MNYLYFLTWPLAYLVGGINFGIIISKLFFKEDVRKSGSGNAGATNMLRRFGKLPAALVFVGDMFKGAAVVLFAKWATGHDESLIYVVLVAGFLTVIGHIFPIYFKFKGGKGVATTLGVILAVEPVAAAVLLGVFLIITITTRYISLGSIISALLLPVSMFILAYNRGEPVLARVLFGAVLAILIIYMHRQNVARLLKGTENKVSAGKR